MTDSKTDLENEILRIIQEEIDREVKQEIAVAYFVDQGWTKVSISNEDLDEIGPWMQENINGNWRGFTTQWVFEDPKEALLFKMRWS